MKLTADQLSEQAGAAVASRMLNAMSMESAQAQRLDILLSSLSEVADSPASLPGFAAVLVAQLDLAMKIK